MAPSVIVLCLIVVYETHAQFVDPFPSPSIQNVSRVPDDIDDRLEGSQVIEIPPEFVLPRPLIPSLSPRVAHLVEPPEEPASPLTNDPESRNPMLPPEQPVFNGPLFPIQSIFAELLPSFFGPSIDNTENPNIPITPNPDFLTPGFFPQDPEITPREIFPNNQWPSTEKTAIPTNDPIPEIPQQPNVESPTGNIEVPSPSPEIPMETITEPPNAIRGTFPIEPVPEIPTRQDMEPITRNPGMPPVTPQSDNTTQTSTDRSPRNFENVPIIPSVGIPILPPATSTPIAQPTVVRLPVESPNRNTELPSVTPIPPNSLKFPVEQSFLNQQIPPVNPGTPIRFPEIRVSPNSNVPVTEDPLKRFVGFTPGNVGTPPPRLPSISVNPGQFPQEPIPKNTQLPNFSGNPGMPIIQDSAEMTTLPENTRIPTTTRDTEFPTFPETQVNPGMPTIPDTQVNPGMPTIPDTQVNPGMPTIPENPGTTIIPGNSGIPVNTGIPETPRNPEITTFPRNPEFQVNPEIPTIPGNQGMPTFPGTQGMTRNPEMPTFPGNPEMPTFPGNPEMPTFPGNPEMPTFPGNPEMPTFPGNPEMPIFSGNPQTQIFPVNPETPTRTANPEIPISPGNPEIPNSPGNPEFPISPGNTVMSPFPGNPGLPSFPGNSNQFTVEPFTDIPRATLDSFQPPENRPIPTSRPFPEIPIRFPSQPTIRPIINNPIESNSENSRKEPIFENPIRFPVEPVTGAPVVPGVPNPGIPTIPPFSIDVGNPAPTADISIPVSTVGIPMTQKPILATFIPFPGNPVRLPNDENPVMPTVVPFPIQFPINTIGPIIGNLNMPSISPPVNFNIPTAKPSSENPMVTNKILDNPTMFTAAPIQLSTVYVPTYNVKPRIRHEPNSDSYRPSTKNPEILPIPLAIRKPEDSINRPGVEYPTQTVVAPASQNLSTSTKSPGSSGISPEDLAESITTLSSIIDVPLVTTDEDMLIPRGKPHNKPKHPKAPKPKHPKPPKAKP